MGLFRKDTREKMRCDYTGDFLGVRHKSLEFMENADFMRAWSASQKAAAHGWSTVPDVRWRVHIAIWAARHGLNLEGDFVECGVYTGILSLAICHHVQFQNIDKKFYLFDLWDSIPLETVTEAEKEAVRKHNEDLYGQHNVYESTKQAFAQFPNCTLVKGLLPDTLTQAPEKIAYLSVDLNNMPAERACIETLWPRLTPGAIVVLDDYGWNGHDEQRHMWNDFAASQRTSVATLPTGQGILIKP